MSVSIEEFRDLAENSCVDEYKDYMIYMELSRMRLLSDPLRRSLSRMAEQERAHYEFWKKYAGECKIRSLRLKLEIFLLKIMVLIMGVTFVVKSLERHEKDVIKTYERARDHIKKEDLPEFERIIGEERDHEENLLLEVPEGRIKYMSFTVLGLSDALIEIAGIHAGTLGVYSNTFMAGLAGLVAGVAASIAMASAAYAQAKQLPDVGRAGIASLYTGISYMITAVLLALPYFMIHDILLALFTSLAISIGILAYISLYSMIILERSFTRELAETTLIIFGATAVLYIFGEFVRGILGITI
ncbi:MAG: ferritin family protein [Sulfolobales archaeon]